MIDVREYFRDLFTSPATEEGFSPPYDCYGNIVDSIEWDIDGHEEYVLELRDDSDCSVPINERPVYEMRIRLKSGNPDW